MFKKILIVLLFISTVVAAQGNKAKPVLHEISNKEIVQSVYPNAAKVEKVNAYWFKVLDSNNKSIGYAMSSANFCNNIIGYNNTTPVMILTDNKWVIKKVAILSNCETLSYVSRLEKKGFFNLWDGKTLKEAKTVRPDGYTGATCTAIAVSKNIDFLLNKGVKVLPKN